MGPKDQIKVIQKKRGGVALHGIPVYKKKKKKNNAICEDFLYDVYFCQCLLRCLLLSCL